jgi:hypothetical protein
MDGCGCDGGPAADVDVVDDGGDGFAIDAAFDEAIFFVYKWVF